MRMPDLKMMCISALVVGGCGTGDPSDESGSGDGTHGSTTAQTTTNVPTTDGPTSTDPLPPPGGPVTVCTSLTPDLTIIDAFANATIAVNSAGTSLYETIGDQRRR